MRTSVKFGTGKCLVSPYSCAHRPRQGCLGEARLLGTACLLLRVFSVSSQRLSLGPPFLTELRSLLQRAVLKNVSNLPSISSQQPRTKVWHCSSLFGLTYLVGRALLRSTSDELVTQNQNVDLKDNEQGCWGYGGPWSSLGRCMFFKYYGAFLRAPTSFSLRFLNF